MIQSPAGYQGDVRIKRYLDFYQAGYGVAMLSSGVAFSPLSLFANGEQGGWYDPSDLTTLYQDAAGTTPVTAVEQPVGLVLDKSRGLVLGSELVTNGGPFTTTTGWATEGLSLTASGGTLNAVSTGAVGGLIYGGWLGSGSAAIAYFEISVTITALTGRVRVQIYGSNSTGDWITAPGTYRVRLNQQAANGNVGLNTDQATTISVSSFSVKQVQGSHLSQSTAAARPVLSARVNLLTQTEAFNAAVWLKPAGTTTINPNQATAPDGTTTADLVTATAGSACHYVAQNNSVSGSVTATIYAKSGTASWLGLGSGYTNGNETAWFNLTNGTVGTVVSGGSASIVNAGNGWWRCSHTRSSWTGGAILPFVTNADNVSVFNAAGTETIYLWGADLRPANAGVGLPSYQRVGAATDYDTTGFPLYLAFDGTDDFYVHGFGINGNVSLVAGVVRTGGTGIQGIIGVTPPSTRLVGHILANSVDPNWGVYAGGAFQSSGQSILSAPAVLVNIAEPSLPSQKLYTNQTLSATITGSLYAGDGDNRRTVGIEGTPGNRFFRGNLYGAIALGRLMTEAERATSTTWMGSKMGLSV